MITAIAEMDGSITPYEPQREASLFVRDQLTGS
jgi:hypothetical protein